MTKKKKARSRKPKQRQTADPPLPDRRLLDQTMASIHALLEGREFGSIAEMNQYLQEVLAAGGPLPPPPDETPLQKAQAVVYQALEASGKKRLQLARQALVISPDCADAYVLLAEEAAHNAAKANDYYAKGLEAGRRALGPEVFANHAGHFWGMVETRPFMRALDGYARTLWLLGNRQASVAHQQEMLRLNPGDNQGIRYFLVHCLLDLQRFDELERLFAEFDEDISAAMVYPRALAAFLQEDPSSEAGDLLVDALAANPFVPPFLLGEKRLPRSLPATYGLGDESEAHYYVAQYGAFWTRSKGALAWLDETWAETAAGDEEDEEEYDWFPAFSVAQFLADNGFPSTEHAAIRRCLATGLGNYLHGVHGHWRYGKQPVELLDEYLQIPYLFGIGAVEVIHAPRLRTETKLLVCQHALENAQLGAEGGVPLRPVGHGGIYGHRGEDDA